MPSADGGDRIQRTPPALNALNSAFWLSGRDGQLKIYRCADCGHWLHPPSPVCRLCHSTSVEPTAVAGSGRVASFTVNHQRWGPQATEPYVIAIIELDEQPGLNVLSNVVDCPIGEMKIGLPVAVVFRALDDVWLPLFRPQPAE